jgi:beta-N-acetylhexosaminidase
MIFKAMFPRFILILALLVCSAQLAIAAVHELPGRSSALEIFSKKDSWVEHTLKNMTLSEKIGQMIIASIEGRYKSSDDKDYLLISRLAQEGKVGGVMFLKGDTFGAGLLANHFQSLAPYPLLISADMERGLAMRLQGATEFPPSMALAATRNTELAYEMAKVVAREAKAVGIHQNYAPTVDLNINPANPIINTRSFGDSIPLAISMSAAIIDGLQSNGVIATAKHFPGHGDVIIDSHHALPVLEADRSRLSEYELMPFKAAIDQGIMSIMIGHLAVPKLTGTLEPASISRTIVTDLLRRDLGFKGLIVTDAMNMKALYNGENVEEISIKAVQAGNDLVLFPPDPQLTHSAILSAVQNGTISSEQVDASVRRILLVKRWLGLDKKKLVDISRLQDHMNQPKDLRLAETISVNAVTVVKDPYRQIPLKQSGSGKVLNIILQDKTDLQTGNGFIEKFSLEFLSDTVRLDPSSDSLAYRNAADLASSASAVILTTYIQVFSGSGTLKLNEKQQQFVHSLSGKFSAEKPLILVSFGSPYLIDSFPEIRTSLCAYTSNAFTESSVVKVLKGIMKASGRLPVSLRKTTP